MKREILCLPLRELPLSLFYFEIQRARVNGVTLLRVLINEPRAPSSPCPTSFSPLDSTPSIFNHKEVSAPPPRLSLLWSVIATYILVPSFISLFTLVLTCLSPREFSAASDTNISQFSSKRSLERETKLFTATYSSIS